MKFSYCHIHFQAKNHQNLNKCSVKLTSNTKCQKSYTSIPKLKILKLIISRNQQIAGHLLPLRENCH